MVWQRVATMMLPPSGVLPLNALPAAQMQQERDREEADWAVKLIRVFPQRTALTPTDELTFIGDPPLMRPEADEVHISVTFTWDIPEGERLRDAWAEYYPVVKIGGPAFGNIGIDFVAGRYIKLGVTFTTRGCNNHCPWCLVPEREGRLIEIENFAPGYIVNDNNLLQASRDHMLKVFAMLKAQHKAAIFSGGLQASLVDDWVAEQFKALRIEQLFLAADTEGALKPLGQALKKLAFLGRRKLRVYTLVGRGTIESDTERLMAVWKLGGMPFAQLYQPPDRYIDYARPWRELSRLWSRPAAMISNFGE